MRRRPRHRAKGLVADPTTALDISAYEPVLPLKVRGKALWENFVTDPPFWWDEADLPMASMLCTVTDAAGAALRSTETSAAGKAAILREWRSLAGELGLSPTARGRLKMTEAQGVAAARKVEAMEAKRGAPKADAIDLDDLADNDG